MSLESYIQKFNNLRVNTSNGTASPHKICMLLAFLDLARAGGLGENKILFGPVSEYNTCNNDCNSETEINIMNTASENGGKHVKRCSHVTSKIINIFSHLLNQRLHCKLRVSSCCKQMSNKCSRCIGSTRHRRDIIDRVKHVLSRQSL